MDWGLLDRLCPLARVKWINTKEESIYNFLFKLGINLYLLPHPTGFTYKYVCDSLGIEQLSDDGYVTPKEAENVGFIECLIVLEKLLQQNK